MFCVVETNIGTEDSEIFECPSNWFCKNNNTITYPALGKKFQSWKGRTDKPPYSHGAKWVTEPAKLRAEFEDYQAAVECAKRLEIMNTTEEEMFRTNRRSVNASRGILIPTDISFNSKNFLIT